MTSNTENLTDREQLHGLRTCLQCKGICHEDSLRQKGKQGTGRRAHYFCSYQCLKLYYAYKFYTPYREIMERHDKMDEYEEKMEEMAQKTLERYEFIDMITA